MNRITPQLVIGRLLTGILFFIATELHSQNKPNILSGVITSAEDQSPLIGATIRMSNGQGVITDENGRYQLSLDTGTYEMSVTYVGHQSLTINLEFLEDKVLNVALHIGEQQLKEVMVTSTSYRDLQEQPGQTTISAERLARLPFVFGVRDVIKAIQLLPGVQVSATGSSELFVRGGGADQNLVLLDGVPIYNANHLFGFLSVFNDDVVEDATLIKSGFPARYGGRLSSILDIGVRDGSFDQVRAKITAGILASGMMVEGPIKKDTTAFLLTARGSLLGSLGLTVWNNNLSEPDSTSNKFRYYFNDFNGKVTHRFTSKHSVSLSGYYGNELFTNSRQFQDVLQETDIDKTLDWTNASGAIHWKSELSDQRSLNVSFGYSFYQLGLLTNDDRKIQFSSSGVSFNRQIDYNYYSGIEDWSISATLNETVGGHQLRYGVGQVWHRFTPGNGDIKITETLNNDSFPQVETSQATIGAEEVNALEQFFFIEEEWKPIPRLTLNGGIHFSGWRPESNEIGYLNFQPRLLSRYKLSERETVSFSYSRMVQYIHLLANPTLGVSADLWVPSTLSVSPQKSDQLATSFTHTFNKYKLTVESYYKWMRGMIDYKDGYSLLGAGGEWERSIETGGTGTSKGLEFLLEKLSGKTTGWIAYTLSWTDRQFGEINDGVKYPFTYDRRHALNVVLNHQLTEYMNLGLTWVFSSGNWTTIPELKYNVVANVGPEIGLIEVKSAKDRNNYQFPTYHRLDLNLNIVRPKERFTAEWNFGLYNAYSRLNPTFLYLEITEENKAKMQALSIFPILPAITYSLKFN